ncbi:ubiquitin carboxy-terminal hydrolase (macronuclear) [Tetrahymena thermophila SB210]|uniref:ubiquitinyl hydrolase 1 n=1 Tax=Tetrahymena thermophila (strain SB210) TaxID=312017 RepID=W7X3W0_TETTS|nr:ubiquitin carboxy-terminal hydrolase [Tetrahymena thermophila SB210]EWS72122.1 ubiquitin carboxy-terminal hydrolase [Tetrahymena thermophila SB210]|eukprot:XP_012655344.1 ubiquitin carboxy-terminal hydrolase [Tetrahymena thermophila SB210]
MEFIYKRVTFQLGDVLNSDSFYPNSFLKENGIKPLDEDETEEEIQRKRILLEKQEEERQRQIKQEQEELEQLKKSQEQKQLEENERIQKEQSEKIKQAQKGILKKSKTSLKQPIQLDEYGKPIKNEHPLHKLKVFNSWEKLYRVGPGLTNFGNTCFINSVLQVVTYTPPLANYFTQKKHSAVCQINSQKRKQLANSSLLSNTPRNTFINSNNFCLMCFLENHMRKCFTATVNIIHPVVIVNNMHKLINDFKIGKQEDPLTFFTIIVSQIKKEPFQVNENEREEGDKQDLRIQHNEKEKQTEKIFELDTKKQNEQQDDNDDDSDISQSRKEEEKQYIDALNQKNADLFNNMFTGAIQYNITCYSCKTEQIQYEIYYTIVLDIKGMDSLDDCLSAKFAEKEVVCKQCKYQKAIRTANIYNFPNVMVIKINRFYEIMKIQKNIEFKTELNLQEYSLSKQYSPATNYILYAMITHQGSVAWGGHYYSYIKDSSENWFCMNDSSVKQVSLNEMRNDPPYLLFYIKQEPSHQLAIPEDLVRQKDQLKELSRSLSQKRNLNISSRKKIDITPENFYNVQESQILSAKNGSNIFVKRSNNASPIQKSPNGIQIGPLREPSKSPQHNRLKSSLGVIGAYSPMRSRASSINEETPLSQQPHQTKNQQKKQQIRRAFITPQRNREPSYEMKKITHEEKSYYLIPISDEKQRYSISNQVQGDNQTIFKRKQKQQSSQGVNTSTNNPITNQDKAFQQNFEFERSRVVKMPKIKKSNGDQQDYLKLSELSMMSPHKLIAPFATVKNSDKKRMFDHQNLNQSAQCSPNRNNKQFHFYEDYEKRFSGQGFAQQVYNISYVSGSSTKVTDCIPFISPKKPNYSLSLPQNNEGPFNFGFTHEDARPFNTFNLKRHKQNSQDDNNSEYQSNLSALSCTEPYRSNKDKTPSDLQNTLELTNQYQFQNTAKTKTQTSNFTSKQITERQNCLTNPNKTFKKRKCRKRASSFNHLRTLLNNCEQRNQSLPEKLFYKNTNVIIKKKKKNQKSAKPQKPDWQF